MVNETSLEELRANAFNKLIEGAAKTWQGNYESIMAGTYNKNIVKDLLTDLESTKSGSLVQFWNHDHHRLDEERI